MLERGASVADVAVAAAVTSSTARSWIRRHGLTVRTSRPSNEDLCQRYSEHGNIADLASELGVAAETARRWLIDAGIELQPRGRAQGASVVDLDVADLRSRTKRGQSLRSIAAELGVDWRTVKKALERDKPPTKK